MHVEDAHHSRVVADCLPQYESRISAVEAMHNARLIASAPDLLAALKTLVETGLTAITLRQWKSARAAIAKAEGQEAPDAH